MRRVRGLLHASVFSVLLPEDAADLTDVGGSDPGQTELIPAADDVLLFSDFSTKSDAFADGNDDGRLAAHAPPVAADTAELVEDASPLAGAEAPLSSGTRDAGSSNTADRKRLAFLQYNFFAHLT